MAGTLDARADAATEDALSALRGEIDALDDALHDLVMRRAEVVARLAASRVKADAAAPLRPGREAAILRRLLARHSGPLPPDALVRLWREILFASNAMQGGFAVAVPEGDAALAEAARTHFGVTVALHRPPGAEAALAALAEDEAQAAVLPLPAPEGDGAWWTGLDSPAFQVAARLPFYAAGPAAPRAVLVLRGEPDPSGDDRTLLRLALPASGATCAMPDGVRGALLAALRDAGLPARALLLAPQQDSVLALAEVDGAVAGDDARVSALRARLPSNRVRPLGFYATPVSGAATDADAGD
jgi:chorismate mutase-like protein